MTGARLAADEDSGSLNCDTSQFGVGFEGVSIFIEKKKKAANLVV